MKSYHSIHIRPLLVGSLLVFALITLSCNLPAGLQERFFGSDLTITPTPAPTFTPQPLPPAIVETDPPQSSTFPLGGSITFYFNQAMDQDSVAAALSVSPSMGGSFTWQDEATLVYTPGRDFPPDTMVIFSLGTTATASNGLTLPRSVELEYFSPDWLRAATFLPLPDSIEIDPSSAVVVTFNQPVVPLGSSDQDFLPGFSITPSVSGSGEWINTSTYQFKPSQGLAGGVTYRAELTGNLTSLAGASLAPDADTAWTFSTSYPRILSWEPYDGASGVDLDASINLVFNQAMNPASVEANFNLVNSRGEQVRGTWEWSDDFRETIFTPDQLLDRATNYAAILPGETFSVGKTPLRLDTAWGFQTAGDFAFLGTPAGQNYTPSIYEGVTLYFNTPVDEDTVLDNVTILPEVTNLRPSTGGSRNVLNLYGDFQPLTNYTLVLKQSLSDVWGSQLGSARSLIFTTQPLPPNLVITQGTNVLYLTGNENAIPAQATNLYQVSINIGTIPESAYPQFFGYGNYQTLDEYYPTDVKYLNQTVNVPGDDSYPVNLLLNQAGTALAPGLYRYQIYSSELPYNPSPYLLAVSNIHLTMKTSPENLLIWGVDLSTGDPLSEKEITIYDESGEVFYSGETNQDGIFQAEFPEPLDLYDSVFYAVTGEPGQNSFGITASNWAFGSEPYDFGLWPNYGAPQPQTYIYTDRPIYRPGQTVYYRLVHRNRESGGYALPSAERIEVTLYKEGGNTEEVSLPLSDFGTAHGEFQLSNFDPPGYYRLETEYGMVLFQVAEYRKPEINLSLSLADQEKILGDDWQGEVDARYYFDAPAGEVDLTWSLRAERTSFYLPGYQVGVLDSNWFAAPGYYYPFPWGTQVASGEGETDAEGSWSIKDQLVNIDQYENEIILPANYILSVTAQDESGFQVTNQAEMLVHPSDFYIGVKPAAWIAEADQPVKFEILAADWDKEPDGVHNLKAEFSKVTWNHEVGEIGQIEYTRETEKISENSFSTDRNGKASFSFTPSAPGTYQLDVYGGGARTEVTLWVGGPGTTAWPTQSNQKITLIADQESYRPGDEAAVFIPNPFPEGAEALITIERHRIIDFQTLRINSSGETILIPLGEAEAPNVYVSVILLGQDAEGIMDFRQGYVNLLVDPGKKIMNVEIVGQPDKLGPGEEVEFKLRVTDQDGNPLVGEFSLAVVDQAVLALADPNSPLIRDAFYGIQPLAVRLGFPLGVHAGRDIFVAGGMGGGGGDAAYSVREQFEDTGYWRADIETDEDGEALVSFTLPDNLTTWQADALGVTAQTEVGQASTQVITTKDLLVRPVTPRFLVAGDHLALAAVVHNNTDSDLTADVSLQRSGIQLDLPEFSTQSVEIPAGGRTRVEWWGTVEDVDQVELLFTADAGEYKDAVKPYQGSLPVYRYTAPVVFGTSGELMEAGNRLEIVTLPRSYDAKAGSLDVELSPSLAAVLLTALDALEEDSRLTNDALMAYFLPNVITYAALQELDLDYPLLENRLATVIPETLDALASAQNEDGGWGWWQGGASDLEISSYILFGLAKAQKSGVFVDDALIQNARGYLLATMPAVEMLTESWQYNQQAFRYFALAEAGIDVSRGMLSLIPLSSQISPANQALLAAALETQLPGNEQTRTLLSNLAGSAIRTATGAHWENPDSCRCWLNNTITTTAMVNYALARVEGSSEILPEAARYLVSALTPEGDWGSTYETSWSVLALNEMLKASGDLGANYHYSASLNGTELITGQAEGSSGLEAAHASLPVDKLYSNDPNALSISRTEGEGRLYFKAHLLVFRPAEDVQPFGKGLSISRVFADPGPASDLIFTQSGTVGDLIQVRLTLVVEHDLHYLIVEDKIPAGVEILDTRLNTSRQDLSEFQAGAPFDNGWGWWYFNQPVVYDNRVIWAADFVPAGTYQLVYTISLTHPGEYQVLPTRVWQQYFPETQAISAGEVFVVEVKK
jgi:uncharacterized protein YfaS (alpha-2-macroglobulin family)